MIADRAVPEETMIQPSFATLAAIDERIMQAKLDAVRAAITHPGEKGRELELHVCSLLRDFLPAEYGLTTGFIVWRPKNGRETELSSQLDIIIYDAMIGPLIRFGAFDVVPLEAVYGYVEVKASISSSSAKTNSIAACLKTNETIRRMKARWFNDVAEGSPPQYVTRCSTWLAPRAFVVAFESADKATFDADAFATRFANSLLRSGAAHIHGLLIPGRVFCYTIPHGEDSREDERFHVRYTSQSMLAFKGQLLQSLTTFRRPEPWEGRPAIDSYFTASPEWKIQKPASRDRGGRLASN